jgi:hypothetical protein
MVFYHKNGLFTAAASVLVNAKITAKLGGIEDWFFKLGDIGAWW